MLGLLHPTRKYFHLHLFIACRGVLVESKLFLVYFFMMLLYSYPIWILQNSTSHYYFLFIGDKLPIRFEHIFFIVHDTQKSHLIAL